MRVCSPHQIFFYFQIIQLFDKLLFYNLEPVDSLCPLSPAGAAFSAVGEFCASSKREPAMSEFEEGNDGWTWTVSSQLSIIGGPVSCEVEMRGRRGCVCPTKPGPLCWPEVWYREITTFVFEPLMELPYDLPVGTPKQTTTSPIHKIFILRYSKISRQSFLLFS